MNPNIFREYDIRAITGKDITEDEVELVGKGIGTYLASHGCRTVSLGRDCRLTSDLYAQRLIAGLTSTGCDVINIGVCPTPVLYFSIRELDADGGVMITASHNPPEYNGFKICLGPESIHGEEIQKIRRLIEENDFKSGHGEVMDADVITPYKDFIIQNINVKKGLKVGVDAGNGTAGVIALPVLEALGCDVHAIYCDMDGNFPNHEADPTVRENMADLIRLVQTENLDVGIGYDGDGDRIGVVDEQGRIVYGDQLMIIFAREILSRKPGAKFISEVKCSKTMYDDIEKHGGRPIMWKTGHSLIKQKMREEKAELAGEMSGHMFFADRYFGYDDAIYASCRLIEILSESGKTISGLLEGVPQTVSTPEIRVDCPDEIKFEVVNKATEAFKKSYEVIDIDGARIVFDDGWGLVRASNTQPALVLRFEASSKKRLDEIRSIVESEIEKIKKTF